MDWSRFKKEITPHAYKHGITKKEMLEVFEHEIDRNITYYNGEKRYILIGRTNRWKVLLLVAVPIGKTLKIISAYTPSTNIRKHYKSWLKRRR